MEIDPRTLFHFSGAHLEVLLTHRTPIYNFRMAISIPTLGICYGVHSSRTSVRLEATTRANWYGSKARRYQARVVLIARGCFTRPICQLATR